MNQKEYDLKLLVTADTVKLVAPNGTFWEYKRSELPALVHSVAGVCLRADADLCRGIADSIKVMGAD